MRNPKAEAACAARIRLSRVHKAPIDEARRRRKAWKGLTACKKQGQNFYSNVQARDEAEISELSEDNSVRFSLTTRYMLSTTSSTIFNASNLHQYVHI